MSNLSPLDIIIDCALSASTSFPSVATTWIVCWKDLILNKTHWWREVNVLCSIHPFKQGLDFANFLVRSRLSFSVKFCWFFFIKHTYLLMKNDWNHYMAKILWFLFSNLSSLYPENIHRSKYISYLLSIRKI